VLKSGAIAVPVMASIPHDRCDQIVRDAQPTCIATDSRYIREAQTLGGNIPISTSTGCFPHRRVVIFDALDQP
jgi:acyl-coenzyme A synthetase/AMP-(fatty) acid ligase